ncbi:hypothetical protein C3B47_10550 [Flavobacterium columnare]|uniref:Uncharacterized protein n=1 Tax=Flavobacterium columnare TaxID=996 RepID=A0AAI8CH95_9FLAO|nr:hypothetical protein [Flavobacterium columnare]AMO20090.1 hypothetical protein UN65_06850 [Flavobacterium columnare]AUX18038.1 hypothetical protein AQ623_06995 [Flavobacterium columnare]MBF6653319.1 hypothetical protein [Flavobacterium columnare]MEB3800967.1 hypothetical protein [Flavobacterium columnare]QOG57106.1 hypothetical protein HUE29_06920 [Flavobacterium columnare]
MFLLHISSKIKELEEVYIKRFSVKSLGIIGKNEQEYTFIERKLHTAKGRGKNCYGLNSKVSLDGILNVFSGKNQMLQKALENEKYESNALQLLNKLTEDFFLFTLKIKKEYLRGS